MKSTKKYTLGFIGLGNMGTAIARGAVRSEYLERYEIAVYDHNVERTKETAKEESFAVLNSEKEIAENSHIVLLAVTPQKCDAALEKIKGCEIECLLSIVTGISIEHFQKILGKNVPVIRAMPNTPLQISEGATALCMSDNCSADDYDFVFKMFSSMGLARTVPEDHMSDIVAVNGSTPAYFYYFVQCLLKDALERGFDEEAARALIVQTMIGSGELLLKNSTKPIDEFVEEVCSKGGTTVEAIDSFKKEDLMKLVHDASEKCIDRAKKLGQQMKEK